MFCLELIFFTLSLALNWLVFECVADLRICVVSLISNSIYDRYNHQRLQTLDVCSDIFIADYKISNDDISSLLTSRPCVVAEAVVLYISKI